MGSSVAKLVSDWAAVALFIKGRHFMRLPKYLGAWVVAGSLLASMAMADALKSGPQVGKSPGAFHPTHVTGPNAGNKGCLV